MDENFFQELEGRKNTVEKFDFDSGERKREHQRNFWLQMVILSSAIVIGILPLLGEKSSLVKYPVLAELGLLLIITICILIVFYFQDVLSREKLLLFDLKEFHDSLFLRQKGLLTQAKKEGKSASEIKEIFEKSKQDAYRGEQEILYQHLVGKFYHLRLFIDRFFNRIISLGFLLGVLFVILSFVF